MKALIQKDVYVLWKQMKIFILVMMFIMVGNGNFGSIFIVIWCAMLPYTALAYDERCKWDQMAAMMPYTPRDLVLSKYVLGWLCSGAAGVFALAVQTVVRMLRLPLETGGPMTVLLALCASVCVLAITLPLMFRFGVERGRMTMFLVIFLVCGGAGLMASVLAPDSALVPGNMTALMSMAAVLAPFAAAALTAVSIPLSLRQYAARQ